MGLDSYFLGKSLGKGKTIIGAMKKFHESKPFGYCNISTVTCMPALALRSVSATASAVLLPSVCCEVDSATECTVGYAAR